MTEQQMPARIWVEVCGFGGIWSPAEHQGHEHYVRSDLAERMADALERSLSWLTSYPGDGALGAYEQARSALSAFKDSAQDNGAKVHPRVEALRSSQSTSDAGGGVRKALQELRDANMSYSLVSNCVTALRLEQAMRDADTAISHQPAPVAANASAALQNDLGEMLLALGMSDAAKPKSPHEVFQSALAEMKRQLTNASAEARLREALEPFAAVAEKDIGEDETDEDYFRPVFCNHAPRLKVGHLRAALKAVSPDPHASDCDKQGWIARDVEAATTRVAEWKAETWCRCFDDRSRELCLNKDKCRPIAQAQGASPSDRPADVTESEIVRLLRQYVFVDLKVANDFVRDLFRAFTVGRR